MTRRKVTLACLMLGALAWLAGLSGTNLPSANAAAVSRLPLRMLWAWERPEDLRFLDPQRDGVAVLAGSLTLAGDQTLVRPRRQPLDLPAGTTLAAVFRIETSRDDPPVLSADQRARAVEAITRLAALDEMAAVQIDFDAVVSEREFYGALLRQLRHRLPAGLPLTVTALASWCMDDPWLAGLPIDDAVPMLFRMGADGQAIRRHLAEGDDFRAASCRASAGVATDEPVPRLPASRRVFVFHPRPWTTDAYSRVFRDIEESHR